jgi:two-component system, NarL family, response regulator DesR
LLKILVAEDAAMIRGALVALIELEPDLKVVAEVDKADEILRTAQLYQPDVALIDVDQPGFDGLTAATQLRGQLPSCRTLILTSLGRPGLLRGVMSASVGGFILKDAPSSQLASAIRNVMTGRRAVSPDLGVATWCSDGVPLSPREHSVLRLAGHGAEPSEIAAALHLSIGTVRNYLTTIVAKLHARNRVDAIRKAYDVGWLP